MIKAAAQLIEDKGGPPAFAQKIGVAEGTVRVWKSRGRIPRGAWPEISQAFPDLTTERLLEVESAA